MKEFTKVIQQKLTGRYKKVDDKHGFIENIMRSDGEILINPETGERLSVLVFLNQFPFKKDIYYEFFVKIAPKHVRDKHKNDYLLNLDQYKISLIKELDYNPYKHIVDNQFSKYQNPHSNRTIASTLHEIGQNQYSSLERVFFELIQNADDSSVNNDLPVFIDSYQGSLILMYNGKPFGENDVLAITDIADSNKTNSKKAIGYKGIGFKAVFSSSKEVYIKSGDFHFAFIRDHELYSDFDQFYDFVNQNMIKDKEARNEFLKNFDREKKKFKGSEDLPWQLLPVWQQEIPSRFLNTNYNKSNNVIIALRIGYEAKKFNEKIQKLLKDGRFLLFLNGASRVQLNVPRIKLEAKRSDYTDIYVNDKKVHRYFLSNQKISITNKAFSTLGIDLQIGDKNEFKAFFNNEGEENKDIPFKLAQSETTTLSFGARISDKGDIAKEENYRSFYSYLPMNEERISFPFIVNGDFVLSSSRERIGGDNPWNCYLFYHMGYYLPSFVSELAQAKNFFNYLNLLPKKEVKPSTEDVQDVISWFNKGFSESLKTNKTGIVRTDSGLKSLEEIVIDKTELRKYLGDEFFYTIYGNDKTLPLIDLDTSVLEGDFYNVAQFCVDDLVEILHTEEVKDKFKWKIRIADEEEYDNLLRYVDEKLGAELEKINLNEFPLFKYVYKDEQNEEMVVASWNEIKDNQKHLLYEERFSQITGPLGGHYDFILNIDDYPNIKSKLAIEESYLSDDKSLYELIKKGVDETEKISGEEKVKIFRALSSLDITSKKLKQELKLFKGKEKRLPIKHLIAPGNNHITEKELEPFVMDPDEYSNLNTDEKELLCDEGKVFSEILLNPMYLEDLQQEILKDKTIKDYYDILVKYFDVRKDKGIKLNELNIWWSEEEFFKDSLVAELPEMTEMSYGKYYNLYFGLREIIKRVFIHPVAWTFYQRVTSGPDADEIAFASFDYVIGVNTKHGILSYKQAKEILSFYSKVNHPWFTLFSVFYIRKIDDDIYSFSLHKKSKTAYYSSNKHLNHFIEHLYDHKYLRPVRLPEELYSVEINLNKLGIVDEVEIVKKIISSFTPAGINFIDTINSLDIGNKTIKEWFYEMQEIKLYSDRSKLSDNDDITKTVKLALKVLEEEEIESFKEKIRIDDISISELSYKENIQIEGIKIPLDKLIDTSKIKTGYGEKLLALFAKTSIKDDISRKLLEQKNYSKKKIFNEIIGDSALLNGEQFLFLIGYLCKNPNDYNRAKKCKVDTLNGETKLSEIIPKIFYLNNPGFVTKKHVLTYELDDYLNQINEQGTNYQFGDYKIRKDVFIENGVFYAAPFFLENASNKNEYSQKTLQKLFNLWSKEKPSNIELEGVKDGLFNKMFGFNPHLKVLNRDYSCSRENPFNVPSLIAIKNNSGFSEFLKALGAKSSDSEIVMFRKNIKNKATEQVKRFIDHPGINYQPYYLRNTVQWIFESELTLDKEIIGIINDIQNSTNFFDQYPLITINSQLNRNLDLLKDFRYIYENKKNYWDFDTNQNARSALFKHLTETKDAVILTRDNSHKWLNRTNAISLEERALKKTFDLSEISKRKLDYEATEQNRWKADNKPEFIWLDGPIPKKLQLEKWSYSYQVNDIDRDNNTIYINYHKKDKIISLLYSILTKAEYQNFSADNGLQDPKWHEVVNRLRNKGYKLEEIEQLIEDAYKKSKDKESPAESYGRPDENGNKKGEGSGGRETTTPTTEPERDEESVKIVKEINSLGIDLPKEKQKDINYEAILKTWKYFKEKDGYLVEDALLGGENNDKPLIENIYFSDGNSYTIHVRSARQELLKLNGLLLDQLNQDNNILALLRNSKYKSIEIYKTSEEILDNFGSEDKFSVIRFNNEDGANESFLKKISKDLSQNYINGHVIFRINKQNYKSLFEDIQQSSGSSDSGAPSNQGGF